MSVRCRKGTDKCKNTLALNFWSWNVMFATESMSKFQQFNFIGHRKKSKTFQNRCWKIDYTNWGAFYSLLFHWKSVNQTHVIMVPTSAAVATRCTIVIILKIDKRSSWSASTPIILSMSSSSSSSSSSLLSLHHTCYLLMIALLEQNFEVSYHYYLMAQLTGSHAVYCRLLKQNAVYTCFLLATHTSTMLSTMR